jgi:hypothetical protein
MGPYAGVDYNLPLRRICQQATSHSTYCDFVSYTEPELVVLNVYGAPESIPRNEFRQPM